MSVISQGFRLSYEIIAIATIKPGGAGTMENGTAYSASVKFTSRNIEERMNKDVGLQEIEENIEFVIPCSSNDEAALVGEALRKLRDQKSHFYIFGPQPRKYDRLPFPQVKSSDHGAEFLKKVESITKIKPEVKAS